MGRDNMALAGMVIVGDTRRFGWLGFCISGEGDFYMG